MGGREEALTSLAPLPSVLGGDREEGGSPLPPECKQQQMNKNKNTKGWRKVPGIPHPCVFLVTSGGPPHCPIHQSCLSPRSCLVPAMSPGQGPGLRTAGPAAHTGDGRRAPCWCAGSAGTSVRGWAALGTGQPQEGEGPQLGSGKGSRQSRRVMYN